LTSIIASGCSSSPTVIEFNQEPINIQAERPVNKCEWPELFELDINGETLIAMTSEDFELQRACQVTEKANHEIAINNADSVDEAIAAFNALIEKGQLHNQYAQNELTRVDEDRSRKSTELLAYKALLVAVLIAVSL
jgi:hypothetical protein